MVNFTREQVTEHIIRIRGLGDACIYFIAGEDKGLLIDTAYGVGDLKGYVESFFDKPYEVFITHGHADHANGIEQFKEVYMCSKDIEVYNIKTDISLRRTMLKRTVPDIDSYPDSEFFGKFTGKFIDVYDGMKFNLGGVTVKAIYTPGHTQGMHSLLVEEDRVMILGDACGVCTFLFKPESSTVEKYKETLDKLKTFYPLFDRALRQHGTCESPKSIIDENYEVADAILKREDDHIPFEYLGEHVWMACAIDEQTHSRTDGKTGNIVYAMDKIYEEK